MGFAKAKYVIAVCDSCGPDWWLGRFDTAPAFESKATARKELVDTFEWQIKRRIDGTFHMACGACANTADCVRYGHDWAPPDVFNSSRPGVVDEPIPPFCRRCSKVRSDPAPPHLHPESMDADLPADQELLLTAIEASDFPETDCADDDAYHLAMRDLQRKIGN